MEGIVLLTVIPSPITSRVNSRGIAEHTAGTSARCPCWGRSIPMFLAPTVAPGEPRRSTRVEMLLLPGPDPTEVRTPPDFMEPGFRP